MIRYYLIYNGSFEIIIKDKIEDGDEQYADIFTDRQKATERLIEYFQEDRKRWDEVNHRLIKENRRKWLELMWKYEPDKIRKLPAWFYKEVAEITNNKVLL